MNKERRIILRTRTFERICLRRTSKLTNCRKFPLGIYKVEIRKVVAEGNQIVFEAEILGSIEISETDEEIRLVFRKK